MKYALIAVAVLIVAIAGFATVKKVSPVGWGWWGTTNTSSGVALQGYDPVSYFDGESPSKGSDQHAFDWNGASWHFSSAANQQRFAADPSRFAPQFGGFCAFAVGKGFTADPMPEAWHIEDGKLYVFADLNVRDDWVAALSEGSRQQSEENWARRE